jgi:outer membrane protein
VELQNVYVEYQRELAAKEGELTKSIVERMERILRRIGQTEGYTMILERNEAGVIFVPGNLDVTDLLIQRYNAGEGKASAKK